MATRTCRVCGRVDPPGSRLTDGRCRMCYVYWRRHAVERPPGPPQIPAVPRVYLCAHCGRPTRRLERGWCHACYMYWRRTGRERPPAPLWRAPATPRPCGICRQLTVMVTRGRCAACYSYWHRTGHERPAHLWEHR